MRRNHSNTQEQRLDINLTPMIDVVFILLIFFILSASFEKQSGIEINRPAASSASPIEASHILVAINAQGEIWLEKQVVDLRSLRSKMSLLHHEQPDSQVIIQADKATRTGQLSAVMDQVRLAGVTRMALSTVDKQP
ncbi:ExbD/TolR family protein [Candidatus Venteria ishoeyi]|uniref:Biopolymer transport protein ExbD n=1 Tax=Candidatus Venteria ishoeyi TaxID=1899563 RepID=A0A1H6FEV9_9GAMM|nr:biopolymer transporter ExbD [Candidatus Venteria ishoeyi]MDM8546716.1 biopolymer transporter ExbD [Candidatus Venteria ishoeyi]SEH08602.1 Biopolymer transport protein ExbD [Candidatus Venteria ishoeyi]